MLYHMVSYFDHKTKTFPKPTILLDKQTVDAHDNPVISIDAKGHIWIFSTAHGTQRPAYVHKSKQPYDITRFEKVSPYQLVNKKKIFIKNFSYMQAWHTHEKGFEYFFTKYEKSKRKLCYGGSQDGIKWSWNQLADIEQGHYQISTVSKSKAVSAMNYHPNKFNNKGGKGLNWRTNLYYMETKDQGKTWTTVEGQKLNLPLKKSHNPALIHDFEKDGLLVYLKDIRLDSKGNPVILIITSKGYEAGPKNNPRNWKVVHWNGRQWKITNVAEADSNYDMGSIYLEDNDEFTIIAPTQTGSQPYNPGGEVAIWKSSLNNSIWKMERQITSNSKLNHTYVRHPLNANPDFYAFWVDGNGRTPSNSNLYFCNKNGDVFKLPQNMEKSKQPAIPVK